MEKNRKSRKIAKVALAGVSLAAVSAITFGTTMAWLTATTNTKTNAFSATAGVDIELTEPAWDVTTNTHEIKPGEDVGKDPTVTNKTGSDKAYIALAITFSKENSVAGTDPKTFEQISYNDFDAFADLTGLDTTNWVAADENTANASATNKQMVYYYTGSTSDLKELLADNSTPALFTSVTFGDATALSTKLGYVKLANGNDSARYKDVKVTVNAYAIASEGITTDTAKSELYKLANP